MWIHLVRTFSRFFVCDFIARNENTRKYYNVNRWVIHELRRPDAFEYDIAVVQVKSAIQFNERTKPIAFSSNPVPFPANVQMTGWGGINVTSLNIFI